MQQMTKIRWAGVAVLIAALSLWPVRAQIQAGLISLATGVSGLLPVANGGSAKSLTLAAGGLLYTDADSFEVGAAGTTGRAAISGGTGAPTWFAPTAGSCIYAGASGVLAEDNANCFWDGTNHKAGFGTTIPSAKVDINLNAGTLPASPVTSGLRVTSAAAADNFVLLQSYGGANYLAFSRTNGTIASPTVLVNGNTIGSLNFYGHAGTQAYQGPGATISALATETWSGSAFGTRLLFSVTPNATTSNITPLEIKQSGQILLTAAKAFPQVESYAVLNTTIATAQPDSQAALFELYTTNTSGTSTNNVSTYSVMGDGAAAVVGSVVDYYSQLVVKGTGDATAQGIGAMFATNAQLGTGYTQSTGPVPMLSGLNVNLFGPRGLQPSLFNGMNLFMTNHYNGHSSTSLEAWKDGGFWIETAPGDKGDGRDAGHAASTTYPIAVALGIIGNSSSSAHGWDTAIQIGGNGGPWFPTGTSYIGTGLDIKEFDTRAIYIHAPNGTPTADIEATGKSIFGQVGIGTTPTANAKLDVSTNSGTVPTIPVTATMRLVAADSAVNYIIYQAYNNNASVLFNRINGTSASPSAVLSGDSLGNFSWFGRDSSGNNYAGAGAMISASAAENWTSSATGAYIDFRTTPVGSTSPAVERMRITDAGNIKIGGSAVRGTTEGTNQLVIFNGTAPVGTLTNGASFYAASGEMRVMDSAGNSTLLSPHDLVTNEWIYDSVNLHTGKALRIDMEKMLRFLNKHFGTDFVHEFEVEKR